MRTALVTILIVLQHAAQLPCRSVTRGALRASLRAPPPASQEDLEAIVARNREITDLLIPLLEANLEAKRLDQNKRNDLLKVFPYRDVSKPIKDPLVELLPLIKRKSARKAPLALILASELRSQKNKKGKNKVHARKAFIIQNEDKDDSSSTEEDISSESRDQSTLNESSVGDEEPNKSEENYDIDIGSKRIDTVASSSEKNNGDDIKSKVKNQISSNKSNEYINTSETSASESLAVKKYIDFTNVEKINDITKKTQEETSNVNEGQNEVVQKKNYRKPKRVRSNIKIVQSNSDEHDRIQSSESSDYDENVSENTVAKRFKLNKNKLNSQSDDESEDQASENRENISEYNKATLAHSPENSVEFADISNEPEDKQEYQKSDIDGYKASKEFVSKDYSRNGKHVKVLKHHQKHRENNSTSKENNNSKDNSKSNKKYDSYGKNDLDESSSSDYFTLHNENLSSENEKNNNYVEISERPFDSAPSYYSEENQLSEYQHEDEVQSQYDDYTTNKNNIIQPDQYINNYLDDSDYHKYDSYEEVYDDDDDEEYYTSEETDEYISFEDVSGEENYESLNDEYENYSEDDYSDNETQYAETEDNIETEMSVESSDDDIPMIDDDYTNDYIDDVYDSYESRKAPNKESVENEKQMTFSQEIASKYANDSQYTVEDDHSFIESSGELGKFNVESVEGLIEVLQQDLENKEIECEDNDKNENKPDEKHSDDHSHDVHKSYKLSFKFNK